MNDGGASGTDDEEGTNDGAAADRDDLRREVEARYDFEDFDVRQMDELSGEEWEAAFDPDSWVTGAALLDRVEAELRSRVAERDLFAVVERETDTDGGDHVLVYSDHGYVVVRPDGSVEGEGPLVEDVKPSVALASMPDYEVSQPPADTELPAPDDVSTLGSDFGHRVITVVAGLQVVAGVVLLVAAVFFDALVRGLCSPVAGPAYACAGVRVHTLGGSAVLAGVAGLGFLVFGVVLFALVANARLSDRFRAEEYRERLRAAGADGERPDFVPDERE
ncbi:DUF7319 domain-containing protein [Halospeciosus flavus]|uniref:DUF7319 domain-containing protein n=1 Tax=Halospeciosus flavus TaxID=3032283 RepID=A0ABD5Z584_9EURY|nr:hypothetical protein [Halospeciosus flavus]